MGIKNCFVVVVVVVVVIVIVIVIVLNLPLLSNRYIIQTKLKPEDRNRTHVFSSFFYKRLTQKDNNCDFPPG